MARPKNNFLFLIKSRWNYLIGKPTSFKLETRIFHSITFGLSLLAMCYTPYVFFAKMYIAMLSYFVLAIIFFYEYYRSRFLSYPYRSGVFGGLGLLLLSVNYFANAGIEGSTDLIWPVFLLLLLAVCPYKHMVSWVITFIFVFGLIHLVEFHYPQLVHYPFSAGNGQITDRITAFPIPVISMAIIIGFLRKNYDKEKSIVAHRAVEKSRLLSILSHDLRTPFIQIQQYCDILYDDSLSQNERKQINQALKQRNDQTLDLVTNLLHWSHSQQKGFSPNLVPLFLTDTLAGTLKTITATALQKGIIFEISLHPEIRIQADADMLQLVIRNLLQNAIKFTSKNGCIRIEAEVIKERCYVHVKDNGIGMTSEQLDGIFGGNKTTLGTAKEKGIGLGLQLCKDFMKHQAGDINVTSTSHKGSTFTIDIPLI